MSNIPNWYTLLLLSLAAWRIYRLISADTILDRPRRWALKLAKDWEQEGDDTGPGYRENWGIFLTCPYCAGFWVAVSWWAAWIVWPHATTVAAVPWAISALVVGISKLDTDE